MLSSVGFAQGGPPLLTDDPATPGNGHWEINSALNFISNSASYSALFPLLDINYGYGDHIQLNLNSSFNNAAVYGANSGSGGSLTSLAVKWRFVDEKTSEIAISTYPRVDFHTPLASDDPLINAPGSRYLLPIEFAKEFGPFGINPEAGYAYYTGAPAEWVYGLAASYKVEKDVETLFEIHGRTQSTTANRELLYAVGGRSEISEAISLIFSLGRSVTCYDGQPNFWNLYFGFQTRL